MIVNRKACDCKTRHDVFQCSACGLYECCWCEHVVCPTVVLGVKTIGSWFCRAIKCQEARKTFYRTGRIPDAISKD